MSEFFPDFANAEKDGSVEEFIPATALQVAVMGEGPGDRELAIVFEIGAPLRACYATRDRANAKRLIEHLMAAYKIVFPNN